MEHTPLYEKKTASAIVRIGLPIPGPCLYDYLAPKTFKIQRGDFVTVPFGRQHVIGVVWALNPISSVPQAKLKSLEKRLPIAPLPHINLDFIAWMATYTLTPLGKVLKMAFPPKGRIMPPKAPVFYDKPKQAPLSKNIKLTPARQRVLEALEAKAPLPLPQLLEKANISRSVAGKMVDLKLITKVSAPCFQNINQISPNLLKLTSQQQEVTNELLTSIGKQAYNAYLLEGTTGSGKTEVYFHAIAKAIAKNQQVIIILPEISLSRPWLERFQTQFGFPPELWHSHCTPPQRQKSWHRLLSQKAKVVVGARSALHLPLPNLGLIIVDEEHDASYKQEESVIYNARDMAVKRAHIAQCPIILASATPSLETVENARQGKYHHLLLPKRFGKATLPQVTLVDIRKTPPPNRQSWISPPVRQAVSQQLVKQEQTLLFLNRRGYAPLTLCRHCGYRFKCPRCDSWMVQHNTSLTLECHHCGFHLPLPQECPECHTQGSLVPCGPGVERIAEEAKVLWPKAQIQMATSDHLNTPEKIDDFLETVLSNQCDIIIGTQIIAKGHHFPNLTFVGVLDADIGLQGGDLRALEKTFQGLYQVIGRAGREDKKGYALIQTTAPESLVMQALKSGNKEDFLSIERQLRQSDHWPPFGRMAALILSSKNLDLLNETARNIARFIPTATEVTVWGPTPAPLAFLRGKHRVRFLIKSTLGVSLQKYITTWLNEAETPSRQIRLTIDIDPQSFM